MTLFFESPDGLQHMLNALSDYFFEWNLKVNTSNRKVVVFRNKGKLHRNEEYIILSMNLTILVWCSVLMVNFQIHKKNCSTGQKSFFVFDMHRYIWYLCLETRHKDMIVRTIIGSLKISKNFQRKDCFICGKVWINMIITFHSISNNKD